MDESNLMNQQTNQTQQLISNYTGKILRDHFGKGPESVFVSLGSSFVIIYVRNFLAPSERVLMQQDYEIIIHQMRDKLMQMMIPEITSYIAIVTGLKTKEFYYDWSLTNRTMMMVGLFADIIPNGQNVNENYTGKKEFEKEMIRISEQAQKLPDRVYSCEINPRILLVIREGILVRIEKELIRLGHGELLKRVKQNLEKSYLENNSSFEAILRKRVVDCFADWDFESDRSVVLIVMNA